MIPNLEKTLIEKIHVLPPEKQAKILEYVQEIEISENRQPNGDESAENQFESNTKYVVHSVYESFEAGDALLKLLENEKNAKLETV